MRNKRKQRARDECNTVNDADDISEESTANGIPLVLRVHDELPSPLIILALRTAETVCMYADLFFARSHVRPIISQSSLCSLLLLSSGLLVLPLLSCTYINQLPQTAIYVKLLV